MLWGPALLGVVTSAHKTVIIKSDMNFASSIKVSYWIWCKHINRYNRLYGSGFTEETY